MTHQRSTVAVVDDDSSVCRSLRRLLMSAGYDVLLFPSAAAFLDGYRTGCCGCVVLDILLPGISGLDLQQELTARGITVPIVFITGHGDIPMSVRAMKAGAVDFLTKPFDPEGLLKSIDQALRLDVQRRAEQAEVDDIQARLARLTPREREVMERVVTGLLNKEIASDLGIAEKTIKVHRARVMEKMGVESLAELVHLAETVSLGLARR
ncbi:MAG: response regulator transcription factor [Lentisphaerae bacterium]|nr:response regulator transcription factor [Lentisphaerota bacterium]